MGSELAAVLLGLTSAAFWGAGDFSGGMATKRSNVFGVIIISQLIGAAFLVVLALILNEALPTPADMLIGALAGLFGAAGLVALYSGLASGRMGVVAPVAAVVSAAVPVMAGLFLEGLPAVVQLVGFLLALGAVWLLSDAGHGQKLRLEELGLPVAAGLGFGLFFILIDRVSDSAVLWPLVGARLASITMVLTVSLLFRRLAPPAVKQLPLIALAGLLDSGGNTFFALAARAGRLDIAAILASLYPAMTVLLAWLILGERLSVRQWLGLVLALVAVIFIAA